MPRKLEKPAYKCECKDCGRRSGTCPNVYETYSGAYAKELRCPMALRHKSCATCKHFEANHFKKYSEKKIKELEKQGIFSLGEFEDKMFCNKINNYLYGVYYYCDKWEISERRQDFIKARAGSGKPARKDKKKEDQKV